MKNNFSDFKGFKTHNISTQLDEVFKKKEPKVEKMSEPSTKSVIKKEIEELGEFEIEFSSDEPMGTSSSHNDFELSFNDQNELDVDEALTKINTSSDRYGDLTIDDEEDTPVENLGELTFPDLTENKELSFGNVDLSIGDVELSLSEDVSVENLSFNDNLEFENELSLDFTREIEADLSETTKEKLKEIDAIMVEDASRTNMSYLDKPLVSEDLDLNSLNFGNEESQSGEINPTKEEKIKKKKKEPIETKINTSAHDYGEDLKEISGAYSGEMERMQATISNLRSDRDELLKRIQTLEDDKILHSRQGLSVRAELDEKKIELTIIRKKLNEEINDLKDRLKFFDEKKLILEEKNRILSQELDRASQKNKMDVKKVQLREKELEQKLELLKSDAESQIRHRDLKILELKRKIDAMEFDMESITTQEKRSVESRFELEDKLEKAIKTLRGAITVLEDESDQTNVLDALKKNIDM